MLWTTICCHFHFDAYSLTNQRRAIYSLQCTRFLSTRNLLAKAPSWNFPKRGGDGASQRERGGGGEREEKTPARKHCENEKHPLIRRAWPLFQKWVADNNKTTKQSLQSKDSLSVSFKTSWNLSLFLSWLSHNAILHSWWSFSLCYNSFYWNDLCKSLSVRVKHPANIKKLTSWAQRDTTLQENITFSD